VFAGVQKHPVGVTEYLCMPEIWDDTLEAIVCKYAMIADTMQGLLPFDKIGGLYND
jgi:hypothetical protein